MCWQSTTYCCLLRHTPHEFPAAPYSFNVGPCSAAQPQAAAALAGPIVTGRRRHTKVNYREKFGNQRSAGSDSDYSASEGEQAAAVSQAEDFQEVHNNELHSIENES